MRTFKQQARIAGLLYAVVLVVAPLGLVYVPNKLIVTGDAAATAANIRASADWLRAGIASELLHQAVEIWLTLAIFRLFTPINRNLARQVVLLGLAPIPIAFLNVLNEEAALLLQSGVSYLQSFTPAQLDAMTALTLRLHSLGLQVAGVFWGLWLFPFGALVIRCGFIPKALGVLLWLAGTGYLLQSMVYLVTPSLHVLSDVGGLLTIGEVPIILWLLVLGARGARANEIVG
jgi:hypothetical protein